MREREVTLSDLFASAASDLKIRNQPDVDTYSKRSKHSTTNFHFSEELRDHNVKRATIFLPAVVLLRILLHIPPSKPPLD